MRICSHCGKRINAGYLDGCQYWCTSCLSNYYTDAQWEKQCKKNPDDCYYTDWKEESIDYDDFARVLLKDIENNLKKRLPKSENWNIIIDDDNMHQFTINFESADCGVGYRILLQKNT